MAWPIGLGEDAYGVSEDLRHDRPTEWYGRLASRLVVYSSRYVEAWLRERLDEAMESWRLVEHLLTSEPAGPIQAPFRLPGVRRFGLGAIESPRGADVHWLLADEAGRFERLRVRSASFPNWPHGFGPAQRSFSDARSSFATWTLARVTAAIGS